MEYYSHKTSMSAKIRKREQWDNSNPSGSVSSRRAIMTCSASGSCHIDVTLSRRQNLIVALHVFVTPFITCYNNVITPNCPAENETCTFHWRVNYFQTMTTIPLNGLGPRQPLVNINGTLYVRSSCGSLDNIRKVTSDDVFVTGDGIPKFMFAINDQVPGPTIAVYEGQQIIVHVHNKLLMEGITIHWHGLPQKGFPHMDGVSRVTQCPISPGETFTYRFLAVPYGTFWYHSHLGAQRSDGIAGALVILRRPKTEPKGERESATNYVRDFAFLVSDWFQRGYTHELKLTDWNLNKKNDRGEFCADVKKTYDGSVVGQKGRQTPVINGKGRYYDPYGSDDTNFLPLETFTVQEGNNYLFRIIGTQAISTYRISIDEHMMTVVAVDGSDIEPEICDYIIIQSGERYDVIIAADGPVENYWIRLEDLTTQDIHGNPLPMTFGFGKLKYEGVQDVDPSTTERICTRKSKCRVINCIFGVFPESSNTDCIPVSELLSSSKEHGNVPVPASAFNFQEFFLNFHYSIKEETPKTPVSTINNLRMTLPSSPPLIKKNITFPEIECPSLVTTFASECNHVLNLKLGHVVQLVLINFERSAFGRPHPIHIHGHRFHVLKIAFPVYDRKTGNMTHVNDDLICDTPSCDHAKWRDPTWKNGNVPGLNLIDPPLKDTLIIPWGGYAVVRFVADNPGYWFMHCHIELHNLDGMALILKEGDESDIPEPPSYMNSCGNSYNSPALHQFRLSEERETSLKAMNSDAALSVSSVIGTTILAVVLSLSLVLNIVGALVIMRRRTYKYYPSVSTLRNNCRRDIADEKTKLLL